MKNLITITKNNKVICTLDSRYVMDYDNFQWSELALLVNTLKDGISDKEDLLRKLEGSQSRFYLVDTDSSDCLVLDLDNNTITLPSFPIYKFSEVNKENCSIDLLKRDGHYYAVYEDEEISMPNVSFDVDLLTKTIVTFDELNKINYFVESLLEEGYTDYILNNELVIRLNVM